MSIPTGTKIFLWCALIIFIIGTLISIWAAFTGRSEIAGWTSAILLIIIIVIIVVCLLTTSDPHKS